MRYRHLYALTPAARMRALVEQYPPGTRKELFKHCAPTEYERLLRGVAPASVVRWSNSHTDADRKAWVAYNKRTAEHRSLEEQKLRALRGPLDALLAEHPYDVDALLALPRLLGDPVDTEGVRLYFRREAFGAGAGVFERIIPIDKLIEKLTHLQRWGAAPFVAIHGIPYGAARTNASVEYPRAFVADWDSKNDQVPPDALLEKCPPDLFVRTGGGFHAYWFIEPSEARHLDLVQWRRIQLALCRALGSDEDAALGSQLIRLPGSVHLKRSDSPQRVYVVSKRNDTHRKNLANVLIEAFNLELRSEDTYTRHAASQTIQIDPEEHPPLAALLADLEEQGLRPQQDSRGWIFFCPCHEVSDFVEADVEDGTPQEYVPRANSTPSGILRVNADKSLMLFCGSTQRCGAGPRDILQKMGLHKDLVWSECGGFLQSDYGKQYKADRIADGTWKGSLPPETFARWKHMTGI